MAKPSVYVTALRTLFGIAFVIGSTAHLRAALGDPSVYAPFGLTAWPPVDTLWTHFVMPNIGWLALCMAVFELMVGVMAWLPGRWNHLSVIGMTGFFAFLLFLGYAFPTATLMADFMANRLGTVIMIALVVPWLLRRQPQSVPAAWAALVHEARRGTKSRGVRAGSVVRSVTVALETIIAIAAFGGGIAMIADPAGAMGLAPEMLDRLPVNSWFLPGVALIICNGVLPTAAAAAELRRALWPRRFGHALAGAVVLAWPVTETLIFGYPLAGEPIWLRPAVAFVGIALIGLGLTLRYLDAAGRTSAGAQQQRTEGSDEHFQILGRGHQGR